MKSLFIAILALSITGCAGLQKLTRGVLTDEYTSAEELRQACLIEVDYRRVEDLCDELVLVYEKAKEDGITFDKDSLQDWVENRIRERLKERLGL